MKLGQILEFAVPYRGAFALGLGLLLLQTGFTLLAPWLLGALAEGVLDRAAAAAQAVGTAGLAMGLICLLAVRAAVSYLSGVILSSTFERMTADLRTRLYAHLQALPLTYFKSSAAGEQIAVLTRDVDDVGDYLTEDVIGLVPSLLVLVGATAVMIALDPSLALPLVLGVPFFVILSKLLTRRLRPMSRAARDRYGAVVSLAEENFGILPAIKAFTREEAERERFRDRMRVLRDQNLALVRLETAVSPVVQWGAASAIVVVLWASQDRVASGALDIGGLVSLLLYAGMLAAPLSSLASIWGRTQSVQGALERLQNVLDERPEQLDEGIAPEHIQGDIRFEAVSFSHPGRNGTLRDLSLHIPAGKVTALTGANGAGKSTMVDLLLRFLTPDAGRITLDGRDCQSLTLRALRTAIGVVPQQTLLFEGTIRENIAFGHVEAEDAAIARAAAQAQAAGFIAELPAGYDTPIGPRGVRLSGGQRQRIALARALLKNPPIVILDEPTAMFDPEGEAAFVSAARKALAGRTVILITHRPASLALADRVVQLDQGRIIETHKRGADPMDSTA
ncbi:ABC transporter ATP-binding protein [Cognatishimia sp. F0-27]|uniref:ABC transporter ATP-binding protein n=1 Tax=Cognatishimia sp. F0-27 TaxID=2816855 RepID=UPI001D0C1108|nr:ABC transporter ATP-binding protein [Cognatishimia sp. F0-27]MCC1493807.1 ABC transporter ATP-binding protein [Cognatishimia sp. F0-27]